MKKTILLLFISVSLFAQIDFNEHFHNKTLRFDFYHVGNDSTEQIVFDELIEEPIWGGRIINLVDTLNLGAYKVAIYNSDNVEIYSRGFSTLFKEWQTTTEAKILDRAYSGAVIFPYPKEIVTLKIFTRNRKNNFEEIYSLKIDPENYFIRKGNENKYDVEEIKKSGSSAEKYDIVFIPEGYTENEMDKFINDCNTLSDYLFDYSPFIMLENEFNIWAVKAPSIESICDIPEDDVWGNTLLNSSYYTFDSERYLMTEDYQKVCDVAANAPYDQIYILANSNKYGGGAIFNFYSLTVTNDPKFKEIFVHELGHGLAGLADEYGYDNTFEDYFPKGVEPWEKNITTLANFSSKWEKYLLSNTPIPTPDDPFNLYKIGVYEGAGYVSKGVYRSTYNSIMRTLSAKGFNKVSQDAIKEVILFNTNSEVNLRNKIDFNITYEDMVNCVEISSEGYFYEYQFESYKEHIQDIESLLREYIVMGAELQDAWYKRGSSNCSPPNSKYATTVIVKPVFVLRVKTKNNKLLRRNFIEIENPLHFMCGYNVQHFVPKNLKITN